MIVIIGEYMMVIQKQWLIMIYYDYYRQVNYDCNDHNYDSKTILVVIIMINYDAY